MEEISKDFQNGKNIPKSPADFLVRFLQISTENFEKFVEKMEDDLEDIEDHLLGKSAKIDNISQKISDLRRLSLILSNHFIPQMETLRQLAHNASPWTTKPRLFLSSFHTMEHLVSTLQNILSRAAVIHDELDAQSDKQLNKQNYILSVVAALFLPITFITGLFGMNVSGIPYATHPLGFLVVFGMLFIFFVGILWILKKKHWL